MSALTGERLRELLHYDPFIGEWRWLVSNNNYIKAGDIAGTIDKDGRRRIKINGKNYFSSRLAWLYMTGEWPKRLVDHEDTNRSNDRWKNLREATNAQNCQNRSVSRNNNLGVKGVRQTPEGRYRVRITIDGRQINLGTRDTLEDAVELYVKAASDHHGEFARATGV